LEKFVLNPEKKNKKLKGAKKANLKKK